jgi:hypothetical protein
MAIVCESHQWEGDVYYFRSSYGKTPIAKLYREADRWFLLFYRGATPPGPFEYLSFEKARKQAMRYLRPREQRLAGELMNYALPQGVSEQPKAPRDPGPTVHPSRKRGRRDWFKDDKR